MRENSPPLVIPVFLPHCGCPHQCAFCNQSILTSQPQGVPDGKQMDQILETYLQYKGNRTRVELAFFGGNFLGLAPDIIKGLLAWVKEQLGEGKIDAIRFSTRPDTISSQTLALIRAFPVSMIELGVQSMNDPVLLNSNRGHTCKDTLDAICLIKAQGFKFGVQVMVGLPGDTEASLMESTRQLADLGPDVARIYPLLVLKGSQVAKWYKDGQYVPLDLEKAIDLVKQMVLLFQDHQITVIRVGLQASEMMEDPSMVKAGPWHPAFGHLVLSQIMFDRACQQIDGLAGVYDGKRILLAVHPCSVSRLLGDKKKNLAQLKKKYPTHQFDVCQDDRISIGQVQGHQQIAHQQFRRTICRPIRGAPATASL